MGRYHTQEAGFNLAGPATRGCLRIPIDEKEQGVRATEQRTVREVLENKCGGKKASEFLR